MVRVRQRCRLRRVVLSPFQLTSLITSVPDKSKVGLSDEMYLEAPKYPRTDRVVVNPENPTISDVRVGAVEEASMMSDPVDTFKSLHRAVRGSAASLEGAERVSFIVEIVKTSSLLLQF